MSNFSKDNKQYNVFLYAIEYSNNIFVKYQTISCSNNKCFHQDVDPQPSFWCWTLLGAGQVDKCALGWGIQPAAAKSIFFPLEGEFNETKSEEQILINC